MFLLRRPQRLLLPLKQSQTPSKNSAVYTQLSVFLMYLPLQSYRHFTIQPYQIICHSPSAFTYVPFCLLTLHLKCLLSDSPHSATSLYPPVAVLPFPHCPAQTSLLFADFLKFHQSQVISPSPILPLGSVALLLPQFFVHNCCFLQTSVLQCGSELLGVLGSNSDSRAPPQPCGIKSSADEC